MMPNMHYEKREGTNPYFPEQGLQFLHLPRTGGRWRLFALQNQCELRGAWHAPASSLPKSNGYVVFVRDPANWIGSVWDFFKSHRVRSWASRQESCAKEIGSLWQPDLTEFAGCMLQQSPGFFDRYYREITAGSGNVWVGRTEHNCDDLAVILESNGIELPSSARHLSVPMSRPDRPQLSAKLAQKIRDDNPTVMRLSLGEPGLIQSEDRKAESPAV